MFKRVCVFLFGLFFSVSVFADSVLDSGTKTAITDGFTDLQDTILDLLTSAWPFLIAVPVIMMAPRIVYKLIHMIGK
jgi:hypothetical protein